MGLVVPRRKEYALPVLVGLLALACLVGWGSLVSGLAPRARIEKKDVSIDPPEVKGKIPEEYIIRGPGRPADLPGAYTRFRGARGDGIYDSDLDFAVAWEDEPPEEVWHLHAGLGHSGFAVRDGKVYFQDYDGGMVIREDGVHRYDYDFEQETVYHVVLFDRTEDLAALRSFIESRPGFDEEDRAFVVEEKLREEFGFGDETVAEYEKAITGYAGRGEGLRLTEIDVPESLYPPTPRGLAFDRSQRLTVNALVWLWERAGERRVARVYGHEDMVRCVSLADGAEIWRNCYYEKIAPSHGVSRATPSVTADRVVALGPLGLLVCLDAETGRRIWVKDIRKEYGSKIPTWWSAQSPLVEPKPEDPEEWMVVLAPCGTKPNARVPGKAMVALDLETGAFIWGAPNTYGWEFSHATPLPYELDGQPCYLHCAQGGILCVDAASGKLLFASDVWKVGTATVTVPVDCGEGRIFVSGGYRSGSKMLQVRRLDDGGYAVEELWSLKPSRRGFEQEQHGPIGTHGVIYGVNTSGGCLVCIDPDDGEHLWATNRREHSFGKGPYFMVGDLLFALEERGRRGKYRPRLKLFRVSPEAAEFLGQFEVTRDENAWAVMSLAGDRLLLRDQAYIQCLRLPTAGGE